MKPSGTETLGFRSLPWPCTCLARGGARRIHHLSSLAPPPTCAEPGVTGSMGPPWSHGTPLSCLLLFLAAVSPIHSLLSSQSHFVQTHKQVTCFKPLCHSTRSLDRAPAKAQQSHFKDAGDLMNNPAQAKESCSLPSITNGKTQLCADSCAKARSHQRRFSRWDITGLSEEESEVAQ